jgi:hypothetical protein
VISDENRKAFEHVIEPSTRYEEELASVFSRRLTQPKPRRPCHARRVASR